MAYTAAVEKQSVSKIGNGLYQVSIKLTVNDGVSDVFESTVSAKYNENAPNLNNIKSQLIAELKAEWDKYAAENGIYMAAAFDTMVSNIQAATNTYINQ